MSPSIDMPQPWDIYEQHLAEAGFLWNQWERAILSPRYHLREVAKDEEQLVAHLDGLVLGETVVAERLLLPALEGQDPSTISAAAFALSQSKAPQVRDAMLACLSSGSPAFQAAVVRAFEVLSKESLPAWLWNLLDAPPAPALQDFAFVVLSGFKALSPSVLLKYTTNPDPRISSAALRALARSGVRLERGLLLRLLESPHSSVRTTAIEAGLVGRHRVAWNACQDAISSPDAHQQRIWVAMGGDEKDLERLQMLLHNPQLRAEVLYALGFSGRISAADACIELMREEAVAALAGEAFCSMTGLQLKGPYKAQPAPASDELPPLDKEDLDADLVPAATDELPLPDAAMVADWWEKVRPRLDPKQRYLDGRILSMQGLLEALERAPMRRRHTLAQEVLLRSQGDVSIPTRSFAKHQVAALHAIPATAAARWSRPFEEDLIP